VRVPLVLPAAVALLTAFLAAAPAGAHHASHKKAIWGPLSVDGRSTFPTYHRLGVGIYEMHLNWRATAPTRPARASDPNDAAYAWPPSVDHAIAEADRYGIRVLLMIVATPNWANGGRASRWAPHRPADLAAFAKAAARRYRSVRHWMIWGEPTRRPNFMPLNPETPGKRLTPQEKRAPRHYARMLDASYRALKRVRRRNIVIGGNSYTTGDISPRNWIREMRLPNGRRPRMDMYGHNPFTYRRPDLRRSRTHPQFGYADFSDLDDLMRWLDRHGYRNSRGRPLRVFISEWTLPTDHVNHEFNFWVTHKVQARWLREALRIVRRHRRLCSLGWIALYDDPPRPGGDEVNRGLLDYRGRRKPAFYAYRDG
jgi:hypothetical protein